MRPMTTIAHKKLDPLKSKANGKAETKKKKQKNSSELKPSKDLDAPKRPPSAFFVFMEEFRKRFKENFPDNKSVAAVGKAGGDKWKSLSDSEKAPYKEKASMKKAEYEEAVIVYKRKKLNENGDNVKSVESEKSTCEFQDENADLEATSSS